MPSVDLKHRLQSLLVRHHGGQLTVEVDTADPRVVGLRHQKLRLDACHAVVDDLDEDARSWVQFRIDTSTSVEEVASPDPLSTSTVTIRREERGPEGWLPIAAAYVAEYDYEAARDAYLQAFEESGGSVGTALPLVELLVETLGDFTGALALLPRIHPRGPGVVNLHGLLAMAAVHERQLDLAERLLGDSTGAVPARAWTQLAQASLTAGEWHRGSRAAMAARRAGAVSPELLAAEKRLNAERERMRAPAEEALQTLWAAGDMQAVLTETARVLEQYPDSATARRLQKDADKALRRRRNQAALQVAQERDAGSDWQGVVASLGAIPTAEWDDAMRALHTDARSRSRDAQRQKSLAQARSPFEQGDLAQGLRAWWALEETDLRAEIERTFPSAHFDWLRELAVAGRRQDESVAAALALAEVLAESGPSQAEKLQAALRNHPALRVVTRANRLAEAFAQADTAARRDEQRRALDAVEDLLQCARFREAADALADIDLPGGPQATRREVLAAAVAQGLAAETAIARCDTLQAEGNLLEAAHAAGVVANRHPSQERASQWRTTSDSLRKEALRQWRYMVEETPHGAPNLLALGLCARAEHVGHRINAAGQVVLSTVHGGVAFFEVLDPETSRVVRRGMLDTGDRVQPWLDQPEGELLVLTNAKGRCVLVDTETLLPMRDFQAPVPDGHDSYRVVMPQPELLWLLTSAGGPDDLAWRIFDLETLRMLGTCAHGQSELTVAAGLEPPAVFVQGDGTAAQFLTPRGRPHSLSDLPPGISASSVTALPFDRHVACVFGDMPEKDARTPAIVPVRRPGSTGSRPQIRWATAAITKWLCATSAFERGQMLALGETADKTLHVLSARPSSYKEVDLKLNRITNNCALVGSRTGQKGYLLATMATGLRVFTDPLSLGKTDGQMAVRVVFPQRMPGYVQHPLDNQAPCVAFLGHVMRSGGSLEPSELDELWDACGENPACLLVFGKLVHTQSLVVAQALRPKVEQLAMTSAGAAQHLVGLDCALERFDDALAAWEAIEERELTEVEARHHGHLRGYLSILRDDLDDGIERLDRVLATETDIPCGCAVKYWRDAAVAMRDWSAGKRGQLLSDLLGALASSEALIEAERFAEVRESIANFALDGEPNVQSAARLALAWLRDPGERGADERFQEAVALAVFLDVSDRAGGGHRDHLLVPGQHWSRARVEALMEEARVRYAGILAGCFDMA